MQVGQKEEDFVDVETQRKSGKVSNKERGESSSPMLVSPARGPQLLRQTTAPSPPGVRPPFSVTARRPGLLDALSLSRGLPPASVRPIPLAPPSC